MKLEKGTERFRELFLLVFTKELLKNYFQEDIKKLEFEQEIKKQTAKEKAKEVVKEFERPLRMSPVRQLKAITQETFKPIPKEFLPKRRLIIPRPNLPARLQYIQPTPTPKQLNLGKLNPLIQDPAVQSIECNGADEKIIVRIPTEKTTRIILNNQEIDEIVNTFSREAKIPVSEGIFRAAVGRLIISAIVSIAGNRFIIKKIRYPTPLSPQR